MSFATRLAQVWLLLGISGIAAAQRTPDAALSALQAGNARFTADKSVAQPLGEGVRRTLARGQSPFAIVLCCADSRVPPEHVFNAGLGELFVVRVAGHTCDPETLASIEYAVDHLNVPLCVVLGHESCGAVAADIAQVEGHGDAEASPAIRQLLEQIEPAVRKAKARDLGGKQLSDASEEEHVHNTIAECLRRSELLRRFAAVGKFRMVGARYHLQDGAVEWLPTRPVQTEETPAAEPSPHTIPMNVPPHVALRMLQAGHRRFLGDGQPTADLSEQRREALTHGQHPLAIVVTCADSRVAPEHVFDAGLGELFVIRVAGNTLNDDTLASIEYAAAHTGASLLVVMGHTSCGAVQAATQLPEEENLTPSLRALLTRLEPSVTKARASGKKGSELVDLAVRDNALRTLAMTRSRSKLLRELEADGKFAMLPAVYDIASGDVTWLKDAPEMDADEATPAPYGETAAHGAHQAATGNGHGHGDAASHEPAGHNAPQHGEAAHGETEHGASAHHEAAATATHGESHHGDSADHEQGAHGQEAAGEESAAEADETTHHEPAARSTLAKWLDPTVLVSMVGIVSLLMATVLVLKKRV